LKEREGWRLLRKADRLSNNIKGALFGFDKDTPDIFAEYAKRDQLDPP
jgi:hypothetical protein